MTTNRSFRIGTRGSQLARWQADWVSSQLTAAGFRVEIVTISTRGDEQGRPIAALGGTGLFTKEIQHALLQEQVDIAVHSLKDLPTETHDELSLAAVPRRASVHDALLTNQADSLANLPPAALVGTGSLRRQAQLRYARPDLQVAQIRGNVETRIAKLDSGEFDGIVLAEAGLRRLGWQDRITEVLSIELMLPAVGQGALGIETRASDTETQTAVAVCNDPETHAAVLAERALLATLRGGCLAPVGAWGRMTDNVLTLDAVVLDKDGTQRLHDSQCSVANPSLDQARQLGVAVAEKLLADGARALIDR